MAVEFVDDVDAAVAAWVRKSGVAKRAKRPAPEESLAARPLRLGIGAKFVPHSKVRARDWRAICLVGPAMAPD